MANPNKIRKVSSVTLLDVATVDGDKHLVLTEKMLNDLREIVGLDAIV